MRDIKWTGTMLLGLFGIALSGMTFGLIYNYSDLHLGWICLITIAMLAIIGLGIYFLFAYWALK